MINHLEPFLRLAAALEADAAAGHARLSAEMAEAGNEQVAALFAKFAEFSNRHLSEVREMQRSRLGRVFHDPVETLDWPDGHSPENPLALAEVEGMTPRQALQVALETERSACDFYSAVAGQTRSEAVQELAQEFAEEEAEHVAYLKAWLENMRVD